MPLPFSFIPSALHHCLLPHLVLISFSALIIFSLPFLTHFILDAQAGLALPELPGMGSEGLSCK